ncbi:Basic-leucine zipper transcription factor family protein [Melia azedarach]|uniref:Basic-leucine zipper transcription factor family protein n=1 Tax=Melia azedarach TaxID=155640 RepID=A0ACC1WYW1_MELAZ|nr:Basic-leucine zipper transcription factor family protein [Melia azedarach]
MENSGLTTSTLASSQLRALVHRRSVSDSIALMRDPYFINMGNVGDDFSLEENLESYNSGDQNHHFNFSIGIYPSENNYDVRCLDPKRVKRLLANRASAQRSRLRRLEYIDKLKKEIDIEEARLSALSPQISHYETQYKLLKMKNYEMKEKVEALENAKAAKEAEFQALMEERVALALSYQMQQKGK